MESVLNKIKAPFKQFKTLRKNVAEKSPREMYFFVLFCANIILKLVGREIADPKFKRHCLSFWPLYVMVKWLLFVCYTVYYYGVHGEYIKCLSAMAISTVIIHVCKINSIDLINVVAEFFVILISPFWPRSEFHSFLEIHWSRSARLSTTIIFWWPPHLSEYLQRGIGTHSGPTSQSINYALACYFNYSIDGILCLHNLSIYVVRLVWRSSESNTVGRTVFGSKRRHRLLRRFGYSIIDCSLWPH